MGKGPDPMTYDTDPATAGDTKPASTDDPEERVEISPLLGATREQFLANWDGRVDRIGAGTYLAPS